MVQLPEKLINMNPYDPAEEDFAIKLDANESFISLDSEKREKIVQKIRTLDFNRYPDPAAKKVRSLAGKLYGVPLDCIAAGNGSDELISVLVNSFCAKGGKLMVLEPDFSMYKFYAGLCELTVVSGSKDGEFTISADDIIKKAECEKPQMLIFSNPCNPTGRGLTKQDVMKIVTALPDILIVADEAYMEFWHESVLDVCADYDNLLVLKTMSKAFGMAAVRLGFAIGNRFLIEQVNKARSPYNVNALTQAAAEIILEDSDALKKQAQKIIDSKNALESEFKKLAETYDAISVLPSVTNFVVVKTEFCDEIFKCLAEKDILVRLFSKYRFLRITCGSEQENAVLLNAFEVILREGFL